MEDEEKTSDSLYDSDGKICWFLGMSCVQVCGRKSVARCKVDVEGGYGTKKQMAGVEQVRDGKVQG